MSFENLKAATYTLLDEIAGQPEDLHVLQERLRELLAEMRSMGQPLPEDLVELEAWLEENLSRDSRAPAPLPERLRRRDSRRGRSREPGHRHPPPHTEPEKD